MITTEHEWYLNLEFKNYSLENHKQYLKKKLEKNIGLGHYCTCTGFK